MALTKLHILLTLGLQNCTVGIDHQRPGSCVCLWAPVSHSTIVKPSFSFTQPPSRLEHYTDVIMGTIVSQITSLTILYSIVYSDADQRKHQSSASLAFVRGIHRGLVNSPHKWPVTRKMFPFDDIIVAIRLLCILTWRPSFSIIIHVFQSLLRELFAM